MKDYAKNMNGECPINIADKNILIIEKVYYRNKKIIVYEYLVNYSIDSIDIDLFKEKISVEIIEELKILDSLKVWINRNVIFEYIYFDENKEEISRFRVLFNTPFRITE
jgi:hypothetical protein